MKTFLRRFIKFPPRYRTLLWMTGIFLAINVLVRAGLMVFDGASENFALRRAMQIFAIGTVYDLAAATYVVVPFALLALVWPNKPWGRTAHAALASGLIVAALAGILFTAVSEFVFWNEFSSRFNFIAVDYLIYTHEVVGNIRESYPVNAILAGIAAAAAALFFAIRRQFWLAASADGATFGRRVIATGIVLALPLLSLRLVDDRWHEGIDDPAARELAGNGYYEFMRAFRSNDLDYRAFYKTLPQSAAEAELKSHFNGIVANAAVSSAGFPQEHTIATQGPYKPLNVILVSIESLGADYVESFGGRKGLTPNLDRLAAQGLMFTEMYATGLRTVRGLEALTLSVPPTPGQAVPMRKHNKGFQTVGGVFRDLGYEPLYLYGGYSYFDNMNDFFGGNGYTVIDRSAISREQITHENIWGVADEDLFRQAIREIDARGRDGKKVFAHIMTTTNHRPFTYPDGRIDIPSGSGRDGAVKYTDWAIGEFLKEASGRPWFKETLFVFIADHTSHGRGRTDLPPENYHIPMIIYAPDIVPARKIDTVASQIDVAPTILGLLNVSYTSRFFGQDILTEGLKHPRAFMSNYLTVGVMEEGLVVELSPKRHLRVLDVRTGKPQPANDPRAERVINEAIADYQIATQELRGNGLEPDGRVSY